MTDFFTHLLPLMRDLSQWLGTREVSRVSIAKALSARECCTLVPGGQKEIFSSRSWGNKVRFGPYFFAQASRATAQLPTPTPTPVPNHNSRPLTPTFTNLHNRGQLYIYRGHKGFIRMALEYRARLVPALSMGEWELMDNIHLPIIQKPARKLLGFPAPFVPMGQ